MQDARSYFAMVRAASQRIEEMQRIISSGGIEYQARHRAGGSKPSHQDPTAAGALRCIAAVEWAKAEQEAAADTVGDALEVLAGVESGLGLAYADVLEYRYIDGLSWTETCILLQKSRTQAYRYMATALDWVDMQGLERVRLIAKGRAMPIA